MKTTVIIPVYNEELRLGRCLESIKNQTTPPDEIIVVDNNSTDTSVPIAHSFGVKVVKEKNQGRSYARNKGFNSASHELILRTDADAVVPQDWVQRIRHHFEKDPELVGFSGSTRYNDVPGVIQMNQWQVNLFFKLCKIALGHDGMYGPNSALRKSAWEKIKNDVCMDDRKIHEDIDLSIHLSKVGKILYDPTIVVDCSARRWKQIWPYFDYSYRTIVMIRNHKRKEGLPVSMS